VWTWFIVVACINQWLFTCYELTGIYRLLSDLQYLIFYGNFVFTPARSATFVITFKRNDQDITQTMNY
jgi:hypothetical protein